MTSPERTYLGQMFKLDLDDETIEQFSQRPRRFALKAHSPPDAFACIMCTAARNSPGPI